MTKFLVKRYKTMKLFNKLQNKTIGLLQYKDLRCIIYVLNIQKREIIRK